MEYFNTNILPDATNFHQHRITLGPCGPTRAEQHTGLFSQNHDVTTTEPGQQNYLDTYRNGIKVGNEWFGPWEFDLAGRAGLPRTPVDPRVNNLGKRDADDDPQAFSGDIFQWLAREGVKMALVGKYQNGYFGTSATIAPPGISWCFIEDSQNNMAWSSVTHEYFGANAWDGNGQPTVQNTYQYQRTPTKLQWAANVSTVTCTNHGLHTGDEVIVDSCPDASYNGTFTVTAVAGTTFSYANTTAGSTVTTPGATRVYIRRYHEGQLLANSVLAFLDTVNDADQFYCYLAPRMVHVNASNTYTQTAEFRYLNTVPQTDAFYFGGVAGATGPAGPSAANRATYAPKWEARQEMMASIDDMLSAICTEMTARWGSSWTLIVTDDNGDQIGEQDATTGRNDAATKTAVWEGSARSCLFIKSPVMTPGDITTLPTIHPDIPLTILDLFKLADHHAHTKRDGYSIVRLLQALDPIFLHQRVTPFVGLLSGVNAVGYIDATGVKWLNRSGTLRWYDPQADYSEPGHALTASQTTTFNSKSPAIRSSRWDVTTNSNPARTI